MKTFKPFALKYQTNLTEHSPSCDTKVYPASQDILHVLKNLIVHYRFHNSPPLVPIQNQTNPVQDLPFFSLR
jgi:hypothetical protein